MMSRAEIEIRIEEAFKTLSFLPDNNKHRVVRSLWPEHQLSPQEIWANYNRYEPTMPRYVPTPQQISQMEEVFYQWFPKITVLDKEKTKRYRKIITYRAIGFPWKRIAYELGQSRQHCWREHTAVLMSLKHWLMDV